jgi:hypothetical protein
MAAKIGILGENTDFTVGTHTIYTVPTDKAARVRLMINVTGSSLTKEIAFMVGAEGSQTIFATSIGAEHEWWTGFRFDATDGFPKDIGIHSANEGWGDTTTTGEKDWITPLPVDYFLATGDTVKLVVSTGPAGGGLFQVVGVEDDA